MSDYKLHPRTEDLIGRVFGDWKVIGFAGYKCQGKWNRAYWTCRCTCGQICEVAANDLIFGKSTQCISCQRKKLGMSRKKYKDGKYISGSYFNKTRNSANQMKRKFSITIEDIDKLYKKQNGKCALSGIHLIPSAGKTIVECNGNGSNMSIDRIDSSKGYTKDNIQLLDTRVNWLKGTFKDKEVIELAHKISEYNK